MTSFIHSNFDFFRRCLSRILRLEDLAELLESLSRGLHEEEIDDDKLDDDPADVDLFNIKYENDTSACLAYQIQFPANFSDTDADAVRIHDHLVQCQLSYPTIV